MPYIEGSHPKKDETINFGWFMEKRENAKVTKYTFMERLHQAMAMLRA